MKPESSMTQENIQQVKSTVDEDQNQQDYNKGTVDKDMMFIDNVFTHGCENVKKKE